MVDGAPLRTAVRGPSTVRSIAALHAADSRQCLLERHLHRRPEGRESDAEELTGLGSPTFPEESHGGRVCLSGHQKPARSDSACHFLEPRRT
jgi:hypothetical protein